MRDIIKNIPKDTVYKDVVVIGNGPSGISLSYMLSGHWPYWNKDKIQNHPDELLRARLTYADNEKSLVVQDLEMLADGLEGRSTNPVSLLLDSLEHPCADIGLELPSMLEYKYHSEKQINHVVIGKGPAGGAWHRMDPNLRTLSLAGWMSLPGLNFNTWNERTANVNSKSKYKPNLCLNCDKMKINPKNFTNYDHELGALCCSCKIQKTMPNGGGNVQTSVCDTGGGGVSDLNAVKLVGSTPRRNLSLKNRQNSKEIETRALISRVAEYYEQYVKEMGLEQYFQNNSIVTNVMPLNSCNNGAKTFGAIDGCLLGRLKDARWIVTGFNTITNKNFSYACRNVVLANGSSDFANRLGLRGEGMATPWLKHDLHQFESVLENLTDEQKKDMKPVVIVGAGLSAADAVTICRSSGIPVLHVYRNRTAGLDKMLPENVYPEYHEVHKMMQNSSTKYDCYTPYPEHTISDINHIATASGNHQITLSHLKTGETKVVEISFCAILIGSRPDLRFLTNPCHQKSSSEIIDTCVGGDETVGGGGLELSPKWNKKLSWLKILCAKCKHLNLCDRSAVTFTTPNKRADYKRINGRNQNNLNHNNNNNNVIDGDKLKGGDDCGCLGLGENTKKPIDCKSNPIAVNKYTNQILNTTHKGLFAMGPLVADNFVRFIPGGALAITSALNKEND